MSEECDDVLWKVAMVECRICGHRHISVYPDNIKEEENQECTNCHNMTAEPIEYE